MSPRDVCQMVRILGIELNQHDFAQTGSFNPVSTSKPGIFVCGLFESPKSIPKPSSGQCSRLHGFKEPGEPPEIP